MAKNNSDAYAYQPGDKSVYINFDAIKDLPEEFEVVVTEVLFDPKNLAESFSNVGSNNNPAWQPKVELMYKIAEACGISGGDESETQPMVEEVDINPMLMKPMDAPPTYRRMTVGRSVSKRSSRLMEDGSLLWSVCTSETMCGALQRSSGQRRIYSEDTRSLPSMVSSTNLKRRHTSILR